MARSYRQLTEAERAVADRIWWVQARDLDEPLFLGEAEAVHAMFDVVNWGNGIGWFCTRCRTVTRKAPGEDSAPPCGCEAPPRIKLFNEAQAQHLQDTLPLAERLAAEEGR